MREQKLIQDLGVQKIKREKADKDAVIIGHVKTEQEKQSYKMRGEVPL